MLLVSLDRTYLKLAELPSFQSAHGYQEDNRKPCTVPPPLAIMNKQFLWSPFLWNIIIQSYSSLSMPFLPYFVYWCQISTCNPKPTHRSLSNTHALSMEKCQPPVHGQQQWAQWVIRTHWRCERERNDCWHLFFPFKIPVKQGRQNNPKMKPFFAWVRMFMISTQALVIPLGTSWGSCVSSFELLWPRYLKEKLQGRKA